MPKPTRYQLEVGLVIQRCVDGIIHFSIHGEVDVPEPEGLATGLFGFWVEVFSWPEEPVEGDDAEEDDMVVEGSKFVVINVKDVVEGSEDGDVGRVGASCGSILLFESFDKIRE